MPQTLITVTLTPEEYADLNAALVTAIGVHSRAVLDRSNPISERYNERLKAERLSKLRQGL